jgi:hypothetical protein
MQGKKAIILQRLILIKAGLRGFVVGSRLFAGDEDNRFVEDLKESAMIG